MVLISLAIGFVVAFALALLAHRQRWLRLPLLAGTGVLFTIPSLALFFLLLSVTGLGRTTAIIVLAIYTLQIIYRNTILGLDNVPPAVIDAARGMGLTERQILWRVELPLATPEIIAGLRVAAVSTIAIATLAVFISAGGLGTRMLGSANLTFPTTIIIAAAIVVLMALAFDAALLMIQRLITPWRRARAI
jgi:osmoprotectant transport system permease protein